MSKPRAGNSTAEEMVPLLYFLLRQSKMHTKEGNLVMEDFLVAEIFYRNDCTDNPQNVLPVDDIR